MGVQEITDNVTQAWESKDLGQLLMETFCAILCLTIHTHDSFTPLLQK